VNERQSERENETRRDQNNKSTERLNKNARYDASWLAEADTDTEVDPEAVAEAEARSTGAA